jgi:hypothetical protein
MICGDEVTSSYQKGPCLYPNPAHDVIQIKNTQPCIYIEIYDVSGIKVLSTQLINAGNSSTIDISFLKSGLYTIVVNRRETVRFVKE